MILIAPIRTVVQGQAHKWALNFRTSNFNSTLIDAMATDKNGNVYVGGVFKDSLYIGTDTLYFAAASAGDRAIFLAKYDKDGKYIWSKALTSVASARLIDIKVNSHGKILFYGSYTTSIAKPSINFDTFSLNRGRSIFWLSWMLLASLPVR
jgi:hypothetical protein